MSFYKNRFYFKTKVLDRESLQSFFRDDRFNYIDSIVLFGSRANGTFHEKSDYDFAIYSSHVLDLSWGMMAKVWDDFSDTLPLHECDYDIVDISSADENMLHSIKEKYIILKGNKNEIERLLNQNN